MTISSVPHSIENLFGKEYSIDFYQRDYKWSTQQVEALLSDLFFRFESHYNAEIDPSRESVDLYSWYYLNTVVTNEDDGKYFIVDGQQRLTTLTLILVKLHHLARQHEIPHLVEWIRTKIYGSGAFGNSYYMGANGRDKALEVLMEYSERLNSTDRELPLTIRNMFANFAYISNALDAKLSDRHRFHSFCLFFMKRVQVVELKIDNSQDVAMVFEVINDRGERLKPYEVFKGELLGQIHHTEIESTYLQIWSNSIDKLQQRDEREPDRFFQLLFRSKHTDNRGEYEEFEDQYQRTVFSSKWDNRLGLKRNNKNVKRFLKDDVEFFSNVYMELLDLNEVEGSYVYFNGKLNSLDRQYLLILSAIRVREENYKEKITLVSRLIDRHFSLLQLSGSYSTNRFTDSIISLNKAIRDQDIEEIQLAFDLQLLADIEAGTGSMVDSPFQWAHFSKLGYKELGARFLRYFFARIEKYISDGALIPTDSYYNFVRNNGEKLGYHVEHILSENDDNRAIFGGNEEAFTLERNRLGGLLLLKGRDNVASSNEPFNLKLKTYMHSTNVARSLSPDFYNANPDFRDFCHRNVLAFKPYTSFGANEVYERQRLYFELAKRVWGDTSFPGK